MFGVVLVVTRALWAGLMTESLVLLLTTLQALR